MTSSPGLVRMLGRPGDPPLMLLRKERNGDLLVLQLKEGDEAWAMGEALATQINSACSQLSVRLATSDDRIRDPATGWRHMRTCETLLCAPPGHNDRDPDKIEIYGGPGSEGLSDRVVVIDLGFSTPWAVGETVKREIGRLAERLTIVPGRHR